jgi:hypothetical protein
MRECNSCILIGDARHIVIKGVPQSSEHLAQQYDLASVFHPSSTDEGFEFLQAKDKYFIRDTCLETVLKK